MITMYVNMQLRDNDRCASITVTLWPRWCDRCGFISRIWLPYGYDTNSSELVPTTNWSSHPQDIGGHLAAAVDAPGEESDSLISARPGDRLQNISISESLWIPSRSLGGWSLLKDGVELCAVSVRTVHAVRRVGRCSISLVLSRRCGADWK